MPSLGFFILNTLFWVLSSFLMIFIITYMQMAPKSVSIHLISLHPMAYRAIILDCLSGTSSVYIPNATCHISLKSVPLFPFSWTNAGVLIGSFSFTLHTQ